MATALNHPISKILKLYGQNLENGEKNHTFAVAKNKSVLKTGT